MAHYNLTLLEKIKDIMPEHLKSKYDIEGICKYVKETADKLYLPKANADGIIPSFDGYFDLKCIDTSKYKIGDLREEMTKYFGDEKIPEKQMSITVLSFGFKYGIPVDSDLVFDVRFIPNPFYIPELKPFSGLDAPVRDYVLGQDETKEFLGKLTDMLEFLIPNYKKEGKRQLIIAIGCTGGRHRSVAIANEIYQNLHEKNYDVYIEHRDIKEDVHKGDKKL